MAEPFIWGAGGAQMTPERIAAQRKVAEAMMAQGMDFSPIRSPWQGAARVAQAALGGFDSYRADKAEMANMAADKEMIAKLLGGATQSATPSAPLDIKPNPVDATVPIGQPRMEPGIPVGKEEFVSSVMPLAIDAGKRTGVDPRIIVAQAALESGWGKSAPGNNLFGIKSHGQAGGNVLPTTEMVNGQPVRTSDSFRSYASPADSVNGYADFITQNPRYKPMREAQGMDAQLAALGQSGYATDPQYGAKVGQIARNLPDSAVPAGATAQPAPVQVAQAQPNAAGGLAGVNPALLQAITSPYASDGVKKIAGLILQQQMGDKVTYQTTPDGDILALDPHGRSVPKVVYQATPKPIAIPEGGSLWDPKTKTIVGSGGAKDTNEQKNFKAYADAERAAGRQPLIFGDWEEKMKKAGAQGVYFQGETEFSKKSGELQAKRFDELAGDGQAAKQMISDINTLSDLGKNISTGKEAEIKAALGPYAEAFGIKIDKLSDIQAFEAVVNRVGPQLRVKGSGAQSDYELKNFLKSLPTLGNTPEGNAISSEVMKGLYENKIKAAEIGSRALNGEISRPEAEKMLRELPDPMENYRQYMKKNRGAPTASGPATPSIDDLVKKYAQ